MSSESPSSHPYDGVAPRNAQCPHCGYLTGGVPIENGVISCPECGGEIRFAFPTVPVRHDWRLLRLVIHCSVVVIIAALVALGSRNRSNVILAVSIGLFLIGRKVWRYRREAKR